MKEKKIFFNVALLAFIPSIITTLMYVVLGSIQQKIPSMLLFFICGCVLLYPFQIYIIYKNKEKLIQNKGSLKWWQLIGLVIVTFAFAGLILAIITPLEQNLSTVITQKFSIPGYFNWDTSYLNNYSRIIVMITAVMNFLFYIIISPIVEELFFRGVLTEKLSKYGYIAPIFVTIIYSLYHLWLPFNNIFRIVAFMLPSILAYKFKDIRITIGFHCACNLVSTIGFIMSVL